MAKFSKLITPNSGVSSTRYAGLVSLYVLIVMAAVVLAFSWFGNEIPRNNADLLQSIAYTPGVVVAAGSSYASIPTNKLNTQVLFSDLATYYNISSDLNMTEYGAWAVSNADYETYLLSSKTGVTLRTPFLKYLKFWIEINYYD